MQSIIIFCLVTCTLFTCVFLRPKYLEHFVYKIPLILEFNHFERVRLKKYFNDLTDKITVRPTQDELKEICSFTGNRNYKIVVKDRETIADLQKCDNVGNGLFKISLDTDSIKWFRIPTLTKARHINGKNILEPYAVLCRFRSSTHFGKIRKAKSLRGKIGFRNKISKVIWRGGPSGTGFQNVYKDYLSKPSREDMLKLWCTPEVNEHIDVGLIPKWRYENYQHYIKNKMTIEEMLGFKYLLSIEGNDVATNLKWALASDSVVLMPKPCVESWFLESLLKPWVHYIPIKNDFSDLLEIKMWCDKNPGVCEDIIAQANEYVSQFENEQREIYLSRHVIGKYLELVHFEI